MGTPLAGNTVPRATQRRVRFEGPTLPVITLDELKLHLRITHSAEDSFLESLRVVATEMVEGYLSKYLLTRTGSAWFDFLPGLGNPAADLVSGFLGSPLTLPSGLFVANAFRWFELPFTPCDEVANLYAIDDTDTETLVPVANWFADTSDFDRPARVVLRDGGSWPTDLRSAKSIRVNYSVGYGPSVDDVPRSLRHAVLLVAGSLWSNRGDAADGGVDVLQLPAIRSVLNPLRPMRIGIGR